MVVYFKYTRIEGDETCLGDSVPAKVLLKERNFITENYVSENVAEPRFEACLLIFKLKMFNT